MPSLSAPHDFNRPIDPGGFCYLCGDPLEGQPTNTQHVVPKKLFHADHRSQLLMLVAHEACNAAESMNDQDIGQLVGLLWRTQEEADQHADRLRKKASVHQLVGSEQAFGAIEGLLLRRIIFRWVQGFHAAIYREFLPDRIHFIVQEPFPGGDQIGQANAIQPWHAPFLALIEKNRRAERLDAVEYPNGQCSYHCIWDKTDDGRDMCVFELDIYGWSRLGDVHHYPERSCVGSYLHPCPPAATHAVTVDPPRARRVSIVSLGLLALASLGLTFWFAFPWCASQTSYALAQIAFARGKYEASLVHARTAVEWLPRHQAAYDMQGAALCRLGRYSEAAEAYGRMVELDPVDAEAWSKKGWAFSQADRVSASLESYVGALELDPELADAHVGRAWCLAQSHRYQEALDACNRALAIDPAARVQEHMGWVLGNLGRFPEALAAYDQALERYGASASVLRGRGWVLNSLGRYREALESYEKSLELEPEDANGLAGKQYAEARL